MTFVHVLNAINYKTIGNFCAISESIKLSNCCELMYTKSTKGSLQNKKKTDLRTLSQKEGGGPDQIPKLVACEIGT